MQSPAQHRTVLAGFSSSAETPKVKTCATGVGIVAQQQHERKGSWKLLLWLGLLLVFLPGHSSAQLKEARRILIFNELGPWAPAIAAINNEIFATLEKSPYQLEFYVENLDTNL